MADRRRLGDRLLAGLGWVGAGTVVGLLLLVVGQMAASGWERLDWGFLVELPRDAGRAGGILPILVSTGLLLGVALGVAVPLGIATAVVVSEAADRSRYGIHLRRSLDVLAGVPSIVFGLFGNAVFCVWLGLGFSILAGGLTLACMVLPIFVRSVEAGLRSVAPEVRLGAAALGMSRVRTLGTLLLPAAAPSIAAGLVLGIGRAAAETAALLFTSGFVDRMPRSLLDSGRSLSIHVYDLAMNVAGGEPSAGAAATVLVVALVAIDGLASWLVERWGHGGSTA